ncbi:tRNA uridine-5-carboxymethylaminomethyl(34) synthesis GTPase MnmE [Bacteroidota bacterium]
MNTETTICAIASAPGTGAIAIVRLSGSDAIGICDKLFCSKTEGKKLSEQKANTIHFGSIVDGKDVVDEVLVSIFKSPNSYTGEDLVEVSCHGSVYIQQKLLQLFIKHGASMASPGEFTQRAFLNRKMDLSQAEAVADLIASSGEAAHRLAINQMRGGISDEIKSLRAQLVDFISLVELELDFSEEDVEFADRNKLRELMDEIKTLLDNLLNSFELGNVIKNGVPVAIIGETNVGKSTLLNVLLKEDKAIVSEIPGTTRDVIEDQINIKGVSFRFIDTAGIRESSDTIEAMGIERTFKKISQAKIILQIVDATNKIEQTRKSVNKIENQINDNQEHIVLVNKTDKKKINISDYKFDTIPVLAISAKFNKNIDKLEESLISIINYKRPEEKDTILSNTRHFEAISRANESLGRAITGLDTGLPGDLMAQDIREAIHYLGEITGEITTNEILGNIFEKFCVGK